MSGDVHGMELIVGATALGCRPLVGIVRKIGVGSDLPSGIVRTIEFWRALVKRWPRKGKGRGCIWQLGSSAALLLI